MKSVDKQWSLIQAGAVDCRWSWKDRADLGRYRTQICIVEKMFGVSMHKELGMSSY